MNKKEIAEKVDEGFVHFSTIFEMVGKPKEHVESTFQAYVDKIKSDEQYTIINHEIQDVVEVEESDSMFSTFCEMEVLAKSFSQVYDFIFRYMPASVEMLAPEQMKFSGSDATGLLNDFIAKMHTVDMDMKKANQTVRILTTSIDHLVQNLILIAVKGGELDSDAIGDATGVDKTKIAPYLEAMVKEGKIIEKGGKYSLPSN